MFGATNITRNSYESKSLNTGYVIAVNVTGFWSCRNYFDRNVLIFSTAKKKLELTLLKKKNRLSLHYKANNRNL